MNTNKHKNSVSKVQPVKGFQEKFEEWKNMLLGKDMHSIRNQIYDMISDCAFFQCINESRKYKAKDERGNIKENRRLYCFINDAFFKTQLLSIRKLVDKDLDRVQKNKQYTVYSLYNLIEDIKKNSTLLTRKNILAFHNLDEIEFSTDFHRRIDSIVGIAADKRSPDDLIPDSIFKNLMDELIKIKDLCDYVNKYIAHSATPESRNGIADEIKNALGKVLDVHKIICKTASFIGNKVLFCGFGSVLSIPEYGQFDEFDLFEYLDEPLSSKETLEKLRNFWEKYRVETEQWVQI
ncbi:MAG: hypothetical protein WC496_04495 [Phycisphaerae bacterium]|jgi:hypothetical protein